MAMTRKQALKAMEALDAQGFESTLSSYGRGVYSVRVKCTQCEALVINGLATHERGCPNVVKEARDYEA